MLLFLGAIFAEGTSAYIDLEPVFDCTTVIAFGIFDYPLLTNCSHNMDNIKRPIRTYKATVYKYFPNVTKFYIYYCQHHKITQKSFYNNIFNGPSAQRQKVEMSFLAKTCLEAFNKKSAVTCPKKLTLTRITNSY